MSFISILAFVAILSSFSLAIFVLVRERRSFVNLIFAAGLAIFGMEAGLNWLGINAISLEEVLYWQRLRNFFTAFLPVVWLLFSLTYGRVNYKEIVSKWRWILISAFIIPLIPIIFLGESFFRDAPIQDASYIWLIRLGWSGYLFHLYCLIISVLILMNLERTVRASIGHIRWQIKFLVLGVGSIFAVRIYIDSQAVLFYTLNASLFLLNNVILIIANGLILKSMVRARLFNIEFYPSPTLLFNSLTILIVGIYFLTIGVLAKIVRYYNISGSLFFNSTFIFLSILGLSILLLSDRIRQRIKRLIIFHLKRPRYDYRKEWKEFTENTTSVTGIIDFCDKVVNMVSRTFDTLSVTIWLLDEKETRFIFGGSTVFSKHQGKRFWLDEKFGAEIINNIHKEPTPIDFDHPKEKWVSELKKRRFDDLKMARIRYCFPLIAKDDLLGLLTLDDRVSREPLLIDDFDLLKTIADQTASNLLNLKLSERLQKLKEIETIQTISSFFIHDLKNLASKFSMTMQNLQTHFENPEFRKDALHALSRGIEKINTICKNLTLIRQKIELREIETDLNELIIKTLATMNDYKAIIIQDPHPLPKFLLDPEQIQKVVINLLLNANEAIDNGGEIQVTTEQKDGWAVVTISDNGRGMSKEFMEKSLFHPFKTTKKEGMGIGLFHSKMIVEAHQGRIEVESEEGKGSTFRVLLPLKGDRV